MYELGKKGANIGTNSEMEEERKKNRNGVVLPTLVVSFLSVSGM
jgi:hypothetical protein